jgi:low affinity Fe/Cu permease
MADLTNSFLPYWYYLRPLSFVFMMAVWIWALWVDEPNPPIEESEAAELDQWTEEWNRTISTARTIIRP